MSASPCLSGAALQRFWICGAALSGIAALVLTGCTPGGGANAGANSNGGTSSSEPTGDPDAPGPHTETDDPDPVVLGHEAALAAGLNHTAAVTCGYTYDEQELALQRAMSPNTELVLEATIYLDRGAIYWEMPQADGRMSHVLALDGFVYDWKVPSDSDGVKSPDATNGGADELDELLAKNGHDCVVYDGPASIFEPPQGVTFVTFG